MKKALILGLLVVAMFSCKKDNDGFMYKAIHEYKDRDGKTGYASDYFKMPLQNSIEAWNYYTQTEAYQSTSTWTDTTYIEYYCTYEEWLDSEKEGWKR